MLKADIMAMLFRLLQQKDIRRLFRCYLTEVLILMLKMETMAVLAEGYKEIVEMLLDRGAIVNAKGGYYGNAL
ncbi:unnamed protein product [Fusarium fujikuroi]|nr:unnamed protein product [Fusarium fujikuroi]